MDTIDVCVALGGALVILAGFLAKFTFVKEGTAKVVLQFGSFHKILLAKRGYTLNADGDIVPGLSWHLPGGLRFVGIRGIHKIHKRDFKWIKSLPDGKLEDRFDKDVDFILARVDYQYGLRVEKAEDKNLLVLNAKMTLTASIVNPYKAQFAVTDWFNALVSRIAPYVRNYISEYTYEEITIRPNLHLDSDVMKKLCEERDPTIPGQPKLPSIVEELEVRYGVHVHSLEMVNIDPEEAFRKATLQKWQAKQDAEKRSGSTVGALMAMIASQTGSDLSDIQKEFQTSPDAALKKYEALIKMNKDFVEQQIASDAGALRRYYFQGGSGGMDLIALLGDAFRGVSGTAGKPSTKKKSKKKNAKDLTPEEREKARARILAGLPPFDEDEEEEEDEEDESSKT